MSSALMRLGTCPVGPVNMLAIFVIGYETCVNAFARRFTRVLVDDDEYV